MATARAPTPLICRIPRGDGVTVTEVLRAYIGTASFAVPLPVDWIGGDLSVRAFAPVPGEGEVVTYGWVDVYLSPNPDATCEEAQYPTAEVQVLSSATLGRRLMFEDEPKRFWVPTLKQSEADALYLICQGSVDGAWIEVCFA